MKPNSPLYCLKRLIVLSLIIFLPKLANAQGTLYVSNIQSMGRFPQVSVGSDAWIAEQIETGDNSSGYVLDSIQLPMGGVGAGASGFTVLVYSDDNNLPSTDLGTLSGSSNPSSGTFTYSASGLMLAPSTEYFVVATAATPAAQSYDWVGGNTSSAAGTDQWTIGGLNLVSSNQGSGWSSFNNGYDMQMAIYATPIPEPSPWILGLFGSGIILWRRFSRLHQH